MTTNKCDLCGAEYDLGGAGDGWDGLCPSCADKVSEHMDRHGCDRDIGIYHITMGIKPEPK